MTSILMQAAIVGYFAGGIESEDIRILYIITTALCTFAVDILIEVNPHGK